MVRVMIVEDEPDAMDYIASLIQANCADIEIVSQAEDGKEAIEILKSTQVDIVITDIQMEEINGIDFAWWISQNKPSILTLIISGHRDFEYAQSAISAGVAEYLLKPILPAEFKASIERLRVMVNQRMREARGKWLAQTLTSDTDSFDSWLWPYERLMLGVIRRGGVIYDDRLLAGTFPYSNDLPEDLVAVYARDKSEICFAVPFFENLDLAVHIDVLSCGAPYYTAFFTVVHPGESCVCLHEMLDATLKIAVPGLIQIKRYLGGVSPEPEPPITEQKILGNLRFAIVTSQLEKIKAGLCAVFNLWEKEKCRLTHVEQTLTYLLQLIMEYVPSGDSKRDVFEIVVRTCRQASNYVEMLRMTWNYCEQLYKPLERSSKSGQMVSGIEKYIHEHLSESLSTQRICDVFGISGSYLSQIFRKYTKMSFVEYVTQMRIEEAKCLMTDFPDMPVKAIASQLGFSDQLYFSKVFRSVTGVAPSEFKSTEELRGGNNNPDIPPPPPAEGNTRVVDKRY